MRSVFITGAGSGVGQACVETFLEAGYAVSALDLNLESLKKFSGNKNILSFHADTTDSDAVESALKSSYEHFGSLDVLIPCAAIHHPGTLWELSPQEFQNIINVNLFGVYHAVRHAVPYLIKGSASAIVLIGSDQCFRAREHSAAYAISKGAIAQMTRSLARDLGPHRVRVNALCPGTLDTPLTHNVLEYFAQKQKTSAAQLLASHAQEYPLGRIGQAHEVAHWARFLADPQTSFSTGSLYPIDGGLLA